MCRKAHDFWNEILPQTLQRSQYYDNIDSVRNRSSRGARAGHQNTPFPACHFLIADAQPAIIGSQRSCSLFSLFLWTASMFQLAMSKAASLILPSLWSLWLNLVSCALTINMLGSRGIQVRQQPYDSTTTSSHMAPTTNSIVVTVSFFSPWSPSSSASCKSCVRNGIKRNSSTAPAAMCYT